MNLGELLKALLGAASQPQRAWIKPVLCLILLLGAAGLGAWATRAWFNGASAKAEQTVTQVGQQAQSKADQTVTREIINRYEEHRVVEERVQKGLDNVEAVPTSDTMDPGLVAAGIDALCMHDDYRAVNRC